MGEVKYQGNPPFRLAIAQTPTAHGENLVVYLTLFARVTGQSPLGVPVVLGLSVTEASQLAQEIRRAVKDAQQTVMPQGTTQKTAPSDTTQEAIEED
jgi:hypothetical protein